MTNAQLVETLRAVADLYEQNPELEPFGMYLTGRFYIFPGDVEGVRRAARIFGTFDKDVGENNFGIGISVGHARLTATVGKGQSCTRKVVGTRRVTKEVPTAFETQEVEEEIVEWECPPVLKAVGAPAVE